MGVWAALQCWIYQAWCFINGWVPIELLTSFNVLAIQIQNSSQSGRITALEHQLEGFKNVDRLRNAEMQWLARVLSLHDDVSQLELQFDKGLAPFEAADRSANKSVCRYCELAKKRKFKERTKFHETSLDLYNNVIENLGSWRRQLNNGQDDCCGTLQLLARQVNLLRKRISRLNQRIEISNEHGGQQSEEICICTKEKK
ncbi:hypothetical protein N7481_002731 [Penicillium waksmanii]|uniref:uncharacterized protein n=1 Tax=Penicillium waksmanii TaxID=69791 RepID=UPI0025487581|nr:uncharacterized protein N7481_002731 [Penicillium waksmanii]KAJ5995754.1 hypothetical protein N7481_002731 [Penicillium waksmanii]